MMRLLQRSRWGAWLWGAALLIALLLPALPVPTFVMRIASLIFIYAVVTTGLNLLTGYTGQLSVGQAGFFGVGAYVAAIMNVHLHSAFWVDVVVATLATAALGFLLGIPILRLRGQYLVMATLGVGEVIRLVAMTSEITGGPNGLPGITPPSLFGYVFESATALYYLNLGALGLAMGVAALLIRSPIGRSMVAVREDELAASAIGVRVFAVKLLAFTLAVGMAGFAGALYAHNALYVSWQPFVPDESFTMLAMLTIGGMGTMGGPILGTAILLALPEVLRGAALYRFFIYGLALMVFAPIWPAGLAGTRWRWPWVRRAGKTEGRLSA